MTKVLWVSRRNMLPVQRAWLQRKLGSQVNIVVHRGPDNAQAVAHRVRCESFDEVAALVPLAVLARYCDAGLRPLRPVMRHCPPSPRQPPDVYSKRAGLWFCQFERVKGVTLVTEVPEPGPNVRRVLRLTRYRASSFEREALRRLYVRGTQIIDDGRPLRTFDTATDVAARAKYFDAQEVVLGAPLPVYEALAARGRFPLRLQVDANGRPTALVRVLGVRALTEPV